MILIFANGDLSPGNWLDPYLDQAKTILAVDGGLKHVLALGRRPDLIIGDADSAPDSDLAEAARLGAAIIRHPRAKDETDLELALLYAVTHFEGPVVVLAALGGRLDHLLANVLLLGHERLTGRPIRLIDAHQEAWLVDNKTSIQGRPGDRISLLPFAGAVRIDHTDGLTWPLRDEWLLVGPSRGVSNEMTAAQATVVVSEGRLLCIHSRQEWDR